MNTTIFDCVLAAGLAVLAQGTLAAEAESSPSRADVKAEARASHAPPGELGQAVPKEPASTRTKRQRIAATERARQDHELAPPGQGGAKIAPEKPSTLTRKQRAEDTLKARRDKQFAPPGELGAPK
jgi:hypothetical protein